MTSDWLCSYSWLFSGLSSQTEEILKKGGKKREIYKIPFWVYESSISSLNCKKGIKCETTDYHKACAF